MTVTSSSQHGSADPRDLRRCSGDPEVQSNCGAISRRRVGVFHRASIALICAVLAICVQATQAHAQSGPPPGLPGAPPGAGAGFPLPPVPGQGPATDPGGQPTTIPTGASNPGLLSGTALVQGKSVTLRIACNSGGVVILRAPAVATGTLAQARYRCSRRRAAVRLALSSAAARRMARVGQALGAISFVHGNAVERVSLTLAVRPPAPSYWMSELGLRCNAPGYQAQLVAPNFSDTPPTTIDVRPWLAWYTAATGWHWLGTAGVNQSRWYQWTATPSGIAEWQNPGGELTPWTWSPISVTPGNGTYLIAAFEAIYWYGHPEYVWSYARSIEENGAITTYCSYP